MCQKQQIWIGEWFDTATHTAKYYLKKEATSLLAG